MLLHSLRLLSDILLLVLMGLFLALEDSLLTLVFRLQCAKIILVALLRAFQVVRALVVDVLALLLVPVGGVADAAFGLPILQSVSINSFLLCLDLSLLAALGVHLVNFSVITHVVILVLLRTLDVHAIVRGVGVQMPLGLPRILVLNEVAIVATAVWNGVLDPVRILGVMLAHQVHSGRRVRLQEHRFRAGGCIV